MKRLLTALQRIPILSYVLIALFLILLIVGLIIGIDSDRGVLVGWLGILFLLTEMTRRWHKEWQFLLLIVGTILGVIILSGLHELIVGSDSAPISWGTNTIHAIIKDIIVLFGPMAIIYGIIGAITIFIIRLITLCRKKISEKT